MRNYIRNHLHSFIFRILTICTIIILNCSVSFASTTVGSLNQSVSFDFLSIASFKASSNAYFSNSTADPTYLTTASLLGSFINTFGPRYSYQISSFVQGTPATYIESKDVNVHLRDISTNQWYINDNIMRIRDYMNPISQVVSDIKTNTTNTAAATNAALTLMGDQVHIDWIKSSSSSLGVYSDLNGTSITLDQPYYGKNAYVKFSAASDANGVLRFYIRMRSYWQNYFYDFIDNVDIVRLDGSLMYSFDKQEIYQFYNTYNSIIVLNSAIPMNLDFYFKFTFNQKAPVVFFDPFVAELYYLPAESEDYYDVAQLLYLKEANHSLQNLEVNVEVNDSINVTPIDLDVSIGIDDFNAVNTVSNKLRTWLTTGVSVSALIGALDDLDDSFFTLSNRNTIETINNQYTDFYD